MFFPSSFLLKIWLFNVDWSISIDQCRKTRNELTNTIRAISTIVIFTSSSATEQIKFLVQIVDRELIWYHAGFGVGALEVSLGPVACTLGCSLSRAHCALRKPHSPICFLAWERSFQSSEGFHHFSSYQTSYWSERANEWRSPVFYASIS